jgi:transcriptional regulator GlxA family with amidase domain
MDLGLTIVSSVVDAPLASEMAEIAMISRIRAPTESQRMSVRWRYGIGDDRLAQAIELMEERVEEPLSVEAVARQAGLSARQLERLFVRHLGKTPQRHYLELRLQRGRQMLTESGESISDVALRCGFADAAHFSRQFKALFGETPLTVRTSWRNRLAVTIQEEKPGTPPLAE